MIDVGVSTDLTMDNLPRDNQKPNEQARELNKDPDDKIDYFTGMKAFEELENLTDEEIKQSLPMNDIDDEDDADWVKEYKRFLKANQMNVNSHMRNRSK